MAEADDSVSMVGVPPRWRQAIDQFAWGRAALHFAGVSVAEHEGLARKLGVVAVGEVLLFVIAQECGAKKRTWQEARDLGIPWQAKRWASLTGLQRDYNDAVAKAGKLTSLDEDAAFRAQPRCPSLATRAHPCLLVLFTPCREPKRSHRRSRKTSTEQEPWPEPDEQKSSKKVSAETARKNKKIPRADPTLKEHHLDNNTFLSTTWSSRRAPSKRNANSRSGPSMTSK